MKVSIVMPVYNSEQFLEDAINSILTQSMSDFELILVDDCSIDRSSEICDEYAKKDNRVKVYHSERNGGICHSRNIGLKLAQGEYVAFCDDDDSFMPGLLEENYNLAKQYDIDMIKFGRKLIDVLKDGRIIRTKETKGTTLKMYMGDEKYTEYYDIRSKGYLTNLWNGFYKTSTIHENGIYFDESMRYGSEDMDFSLRLYEVAKSVLINPKTYYVHYRRDASSTSRKFNENKIDSMMITASHELVIWEKMGSNIRAKIQRNQLVSEYIRNVISIQLLHQDCPYSLEQKAQKIYELTKLTQMQFNLEVKVMKGLFTIDKKSWITISMLSNRLFKSLLLLMKIYQNTFGDKWS